MMDRHDVKIFIVADAAGDASDAAGIESAALDRLGGYGVGQEEDEEEDYDDEEEEGVDCGADQEDQDYDEEDQDLPYPGFIPVTLGFLTQTSRPRSWCLRLLTNPYPFLFFFFNKYLITT